MPIAIHIGSEDVTGRASSISWSNVDPGGFEAFSCQLPPDTPLSMGQRIRVTDGAQTVWEGRVSELQRDAVNGRITLTVGGQGYRALLSDADMSIVYCDRVLTQWGDTSVQRRINNFASSYTAGGESTVQQGTAAEMELRQSFGDSWASPAKPIAEALYDAGPLNTIAKVYYDFLPDGSVSVADPMFIWSIIVATPDDGSTGFSSTGNLEAASGSGYFSSSWKGRFAVLNFYYGFTPAGSAGATYGVRWRKLAVYGNHGLALRGTDPGGLYPSDIARHTLSLQNAGMPRVVPGRIEDSTGYICPQAVYKTPVPIEQVVGEMASLLGWSWGVWEPAGLGENPRLDFHAPPTQATCVAAVHRCENLSMADRLENLYNQARVSYQDTASASQTTTVTRPIPDLDTAGITRILQVDGGTSTSSAAATLGAFMLALSEFQARTAGSATLPSRVDLPGGGSKGAHLLRAGQDRLSIPGVSSQGRPSTLDDVGRDTFHIARVSTDVGEGGKLNTSVELDAGSNLVEVLTARLAIANQLAT